jgi:hypothetical protein
MMIVCISPVYAGGVAPIRDNGILKYTTFTSSIGSYTVNHAVFFSNTVPITINGVRVYGFHYGDLQANVTTEIWDENLTTLYQDIIPYETIPFQTAANRSDFRKSLSWVTIPIPEHIVSGNFYIVLFTHSYAFEDNKHGFSIGFTRSSDSGTSHTVKSNPNRIVDSPVIIGSNSYLTKNIDWMIQVLYSLPVTTTSVKETITVQGTNTVKKTAQPTISVPSTSQTDAGPFGATPSPPVPAQPVATKAAMELPVVLLTIILSIGFFRSGH